MAYRVLITDYAWPTLDIEREVLAEAGGELVVAEKGEENEFVALAPDVDAILACWKRVTPAVIDAAPRCQIITRYGIGLDNIAVAHATERGILVTNVPEYCLQEVSDHAMALLLALARRVVQFAGDTRASIWDEKREQRRPIPRLQGQTLGLVGFGKIARTMVPKAHGFGMNVIAHDPFVDAGSVGDDVRLIPNLEDLMRESDYVSVHVPAIEQTRDLINAKLLHQMKSTGYLINTCRGTVVDEEALRQALTEGWIAGAGLDVMKQEPPALDHPLLKLENVIITPHAAFYSETSTEELQRQAAGHVAAVARGQLPTNIVNPAVQERENFRFARKA